MQGSVSGPHLFNLFVNDLIIEEENKAALDKYVDDATLQVVVQKNSQDYSLTYLDEKNMLYSANKSLYAIRSLRKERHCQWELNLLFNSLVIAKISYYGLSDYGSSTSDL